MSDEGLVQAAALVRQAERLAALTGAGVSRESGVPTFRDALDGLWARFDPQQLATAAAFRRDPKLVWDWYQYRREMVGKAAPNPGHRALADLQRRRPAFCIITQNVDDLHEQAGSTDVVRLHGNIAGNKCFADCQGEPTPIDIATLSWDPAAGPPACPHCGQPVRPDVVWFGENLPRAQLERAVSLCQEADVLLVIGTSGMVSPAAELPAVAERSGAKVIEINPATSPITPLADIHLAGPSGIILPRLLELL